MIKWIWDIFWQTRAICNTGLPVTLWEVLYTALDLTINILDLGSTDPGSNHVWGYCTVFLRKRQLFVMSLSTLVYKWALANNGDSPAGPCWKACMLRRRSSAWSYNCGIVCQQPWRISKSFCLTLSLKWFNGWQKEFLAKSCGVKLRRTKYKLSSMQGFQ